MLTGFFGLEIGQRILRSEQEGAWTNRKVDKAGALKSGIYNLYPAEQADKAKRYELHLWSFWTDEVITPGQLSRLLKL